MGDTLLAEEIISDMFKNVIVRRPSRSMINGITSAPELGTPDYELAMKQHDDYIAALKYCGCEVTMLPAMEEYPDSCFVEDVAVVTPKCAIITNPGAASRNGEKAHIVEAIKKFYPEEHIHYITEGTIEGDDVMMVGTHFYVGKSDRTNVAGFKNFARILAKYEMTATQVELHTVLHLKTGVVHLSDGNMLAAGEFIDRDVFEAFNRIAVPEDEAYAANCLWMNGKVIVPAGFPKMEKTVRELGYEVVIVDTSEYRKIDGGLSCLSLRF